MNETFAKPPPLCFTEQEIQDLFRARLLLENPGMAARIANVVGAPLERGFAMLPKNWSGLVNKAARSALWRALDVAVRSLDRRPAEAASNFKHKVMVGTSGLIGGTFGLTALMIELPVSTTLMLRSIADVARSEGHDLDEIETRLHCLEVFALGGKTSSDDAAETAYWAVRAAMSKAVGEAVAFVTERGVLEKGAPALVRLISAIAARFGVVISEQAAAKAVPIIGAAGGSLINVLFMDHFQNMARGHFIVKRLEKKHGTERVREMYSSLAMPVRTLPSQWRQANQTV